MAINFDKNCEVDILGTGQVNCISLLEQVFRVFLTKPSWRADLATDTIDDAYVSEMIATQQWLPLRVHDSLEDNTKEPNYEELQSGVDRKARNAIYGFYLDYNGDLCYTKALESLSGGNYNAILVDRNGKLLVQESGNIIKGLDVATADLFRLTLSDGSVSSKVRFYLQLSPSGSKAMESSLRIVNSDIDFNSINGVINAALNEVSVDGTIVTFSAVESCNNTTEILGLETSFALYNTNGTLVAPQPTIAASQEFYTLDTTGLAAGDYVLRLYDNANNRPIVVVDGQTYKAGNSITITV